MVHMIFVLKGYDPMGKKLKRGFNKAVCWGLAVCHPLKIPPWHLETASQLWSSMSQMCYLAMDWAESCKGELGFRTIGSPSTNVKGSYGLSLCHGSNLFPASLPKSFHAACCCSIFTQLFYVYHTPGWNPWQDLTDSICCCSSVGDRHHLWGKGLNSSH